MRDLVVLFIHLITTIARLAGPGGARSVVAESVLVKQQLLILNRSPHRSPNLCVCDRVVAGLCALLMRPGRLIRSAIVIKTVNSLEPPSSAEEPQVAATVLAQTAEEAGSKRT
jgi:putative transposase